MPNHHHEAQTADSIVRGFQLYGDSWSPVIGEVLIRGLLNEIFTVLISRLEHGPAKMAKFNPPQKSKQYRFRSVQFLLRSVPFLFRFSFARQSGTKC